MGRNIALLHKVHQLMGKDACSLIKVVCKQQAAEIHVTAVNA